MKTILATIFFTLTGTLSVFAQYELTIDDVTFYEPAGTITGYTNTTEKNIIIPETLNGITVTTIGKEAFKDKGLTGVVLPNSVTTIESSAFWKNKITSLTLGNALTVIGAQSFATNDLTNLIIPNSVTTIELSAFRYNNLTSLTLPNGITSIGSDAFGGNELTSINLPESITSLEYSCFNGNKITSINGNPSDGIIYGRNNDGSTDSTIIVSFAGTATVLDFIPNTVKTIGYKSFLDATSIESVTIPNSVTEISAYAFARTRMTSLTLGDSVKSIGPNAFWYNKLTSVEIPNSVTIIHHKAFWNNELTSVTLGNSVQLIGADAFTGNLVDEIILPSEINGFENVVWKDENGYEATSIKYFDLKYSATGQKITGTEDNQTNSTAFYPNPVTNGVLFISSPVQSLSIMDLSGNTVLEGMDVSNSIDISALESGVYIVKMDKAVSKLVIE